MKWGQHSAQLDEDESVHSRPWVYFMIDCFFLITMFFVVTFRLRSEELILPQKLSGNTGHIGPITLPETIRVRVTSEKGNPIYTVMGQPESLAEMRGMFADLSTRGPEKYRVVVSYDGGVPFQSVFAVMDAARAAKIANCGLVPTAITN